MNDNKFDDEIKMPSEERIDELLALLKVKAIELDKALTPMTRMLTESLASSKGERYAALVFFGVVSQKLIQAEENKEVQKGLIADLSVMNAIQAAKAGIEADQDDAVMADISLISQAITLGI